MSQKDIAEKILEAYNDVFADIVNVLLFDGKEVIKAEDLEEQAPRSAYKADGKTREIERDVAKRWKNENIRVACIGLENQTKADKDMPLRIIAYDGGEYRAQLNTKQKERYPVVTLVLYFGYEEHWDKPLNLHGVLQIPEYLQPYVNDYKINLFEIAYLDEDTIKLFKSDFKVVADYFVQKQKTGNYVPSPEKLEHVQETLTLLSVMTGDHRFEEAYNQMEVENGKEISNMCEVLDRLVAQGEARGEARGEKRGLETAKRSMAIHLHQQGVDVRVIAHAAEVEVDVVKSWIGQQTA